MKYNKHTLRHELKYVITYNDYISLASSLDWIMERDKEGGPDGYFIRSLYFDDIFRSIYHEKDDGVSRRRKYRIRAYDMDDYLIRFEIKDKFDSFISKTSARITREQCDMLANCNFGGLLTSDSPVLRMAYIDARTKLLRPEVIVDYSREVFVSNEGNVRITFDKNLRAGVATFDIFDPKVVTVPAMDQDKLILEVKYDDFIPGFLSPLLSGRKRQLTAASKYWMCCQAKNTYYRKDLPYESTLLISV